MQRSAACQAKLERIRKALRHQEPDRVPVSDFFWSSFVARWRRELGLPADADIYRYYDLDWQVTVPNMDPWIRPIEILRQDEREVLVRTGFGAVIRKRLDLPMPAFLSFETDTPAKLAALRFDDPWDERRFLRGGGNQLAGVGDSFNADPGPWLDEVKRLHPDFAVYGSVCEAHEMLWRIVGSENALMWMAEYPEEIGRQVERINAFALELARAQIRAAGGLLDGMVIWGDVACRRGLLFSPDYWRRYFKPGVKALVEVCHEAGLPVIYHGCGNVNRIFEDFIETGVDAYNPLEAKAGLDVVELRRRYGHRIGFCGNMDVAEWAQADLSELEKIVLRKLNAGKGGGFLFASDHSVPDNVSGERYDYVVELVRRHGQYPLRLGQHDLADLR